MSEIRSQATPARDELERSAIGWQQYISRALGCKPGQLTYQLEECIEKIEALNPRTVNSATELKALPTCSLIRGLEREGQRSGDVFEKVGPDHWLCLDPGDRFDGEETTPSHAIVLIYKAGIRVLFTPGDVR